MRCVGWSRSMTAELAEQLGIEYAGSIEEAVRSADFVVLGMALVEETRGIIGEAELAAMKPGAILINTARGALVKEQALLHALRSQETLAAAGLDVVIDEPLNANHPLYQLSNVVLTPHIGANTEEALYRVGMACVEGIKENALSFS